MKVLVIDPKIAGISGDMLLAALVDLTGSSELLAPLVDAIGELPCCEHFSCQVRDVDAGGISAKKLIIDIGEKNHRNHDDLRSSADIIANKIGLSEIAQQKTQSIISDLFAADAKPIAPVFIIAKWHLSTRSLTSLDLFYPRPSWISRR